MIGRGSSESTHLSDRSSLQPVDPTTGNIWRCFGLTGRLISLGHATDFDSVTDGASAMTPRHWWRMTRVKSPQVGLASSVHHRTSAMRRHRDGGHWPSSTDCRDLSQEPAV